MNRVLSTAATGLGAQQANIERIANDMANVNTDSYKKSRNEFADLMYQTLKEPGAALGDASVSPVGVQIGMGVKVNGSYKDMSQGAIRQTGHPYDLMIDGNGFFTVQMPNGEVAYTRNGDFHKSADGRLVMTNGARMIPEITIPNNATAFTVTAQGEVRIATSDGNETVIGNIPITQFPNERGLNVIGAGLYKVTAASGQPVTGVPGENGMGFISQGARESSNVDIANSMVEMISTQRAYELGTKMMSTADEMMKSVVNVR